MANNTTRCVQVLQWGIKYTSFSLSTAHCNHPRCAFHDEKSKTSREFITAKIGSGDWAAIKSGLIGERWKMDIYRIGAGNALSLAIPLQSIYIVRKINTGPIKFFFFIRRFGRGLAVPDENG